jgi:hypothetical protein
MRWRTEPALLPLVVLALGLCVGCFPTRPEDDAVTDLTARERAILTCRELYCDRGHEDCIRQLGKEKRLDVLQTIARSESSHAPSAAVTAAQRMSPKEHLAFCQSFPVQSGQWRGLLRSLGSRDKATITPYLLQLAKEECAEVRCLCYEVCQQAGWPDLVPWALQDSSSTVVFVRINAFGIETVGDIARLYIHTVSPGSLPPDKEGKKTD